jgi:CubicO group peptidase (beta-lactamase class C family)
MLRALELRVSVICITSVVIASFLLHVNGLSDSAWSSIDTLIQDEFLVTFQTPGLGLAIVNRSEVDDQITAKGYGFMDLEADVKTGNDTKFFIASISKVIYRYR